MEAHMTIGEVIHELLAVIGFCTVVLGVIRAGIWLYDEDRRRHPNSPSIFRPLKYERWRLQEEKRLDEIYGPATSPKRKAPR